MIFAGAETSFKGLGAGKGIKYSGEIITTLK